jgi:hypothetical protein
MYIRFAVSRQRGVFTAIYELERDGALLPHEIEWFRTIETWFNDNLPRPSRLSWSSRPKAPDHAISWLKTSAVEHVTRMRQLVALLVHKDVVVDEHLTERPGYIVYEDEYQIAAIPFSSETF